MLVFAMVIVKFHPSFPKSWINVRHNKNSTPWITRDIARFSKRKQKTVRKVF